MSNVVLRFRFRKISVVKYILRKNVRVFNKKKSKRNLDEEKHNEISDYTTMGQVVRKKWFNYTVLNFRKKYILFYVITLYKGLLETRSRNVLLMSPNKHFVVVVCVVLAVTG